MGRHWWQLAVVSALPSLLCLLLGNWLAVAVRDSQADSIRKAGEQRLSDSVAAFRGYLRQGGEGAEEVQALLVGSVAGLSLVGDLPAGFTLPPDAVGGEFGGDMGKPLYAAWPGGGYALLNLDWTPAVHTERRIQGYAWGAAAVLLLLFWAGLLYGRLRRRRARSRAAAAVERRLPSLSELFWRYGQALPVALVEVAPETAAIRCNPAAEQLFGELTGDAALSGVLAQLAREPSWVALVRAAQQPQQASSFAGAAVDSGEQPVREGVELTLPGAHQHARLRVWSLLPARAGRPSLFLLLDVSEQRRGEAEIAQMRAMLQHEIRLPVSTLQLQMDSFRREWESMPEGAESMTHIDSALHRLRTICQKLSLDIGAPAASRADTDPNQQAVVDVHGFVGIDTDQAVLPLLEMVLAEHELLATEKRQRLRLDAPAAGQEGGYQQLRQMRLGGARAESVRSVLTHLLGNAISYCQSDARITVAVRLADVQLRVGVVDDGPGISRDERSLIFVAGFRGGNVGVTAGTGMGLFLAKRDAEAAGGSLELEDSQKGANFVLRLPVEAL